MVQLTNKQTRILKTLRENPDGLSPTEIGLLHGKTQSTASAWAGVALKALERRGLAHRFAHQDRRSIIYRMAG